MGKEKAREAAPGTGRRGRGSRRSLGLHGDGADPAGLAERFERAVARGRALSGRRPPGGAGRLGHVKGLLLPVHDLDLPAILAGGITVVDLAVLIGDLNTVGHLRGDLQGCRIGLHDRHGPVLAGVQALVGQGARHRDGDNGESSPYRREPAPRRGPAKRTGIVIGFVCIRRHFGGRIGRHVALYGGEILVEGVGRGDAGGFFRRKVRLRAGGPAGVMGEGNLLHRGRAHVVAGGEQRAEGIVLPDDAGQFGQGIRLRGLRRTVIVTQIARKCFQIDLSARRVRHGSFLNQWRIGP